MPQDTEQSKQSPESGTSDGFKHHLALHTYPDGSSGCGHDDCATDPLSCRCIVNTQTGKYIWVLASDLKERLSAVAGTSGTETDDN